MPPGTLAGRRLIVGVAGSIAAYKSVYLVRRLVEAGAEVHVALTRSAGRFVTPLTFATVSGRPVLEDLFDAVPGAHVTLAEAADAAVVAPATAHLIARHAHGLADDALTTLLLALRGPLLLAPAMERGMWAHPATRANVAVLEGRGVRFVGPDEGPLASGLTGPGRMAEPEAIMTALGALLSEKPRPAAPPGTPDAAGDLAGEHVLVTAGPTREPLDPVRFLSSPATGRMGFAVAEAAAVRGARVTLVTGPTTLQDPAGCRRVDVTTTAQMHDAVLDALKDATVLVMAAAVSDFRPAKPQAHKVAKDGAPLHLPLERTEDILASVGRLAPAGLIKVGFAAETRDLTAHARAKRKAKDLDLIVANDVTLPDAGFGAATNRVTMIGRDDRPQRLPIGPKRQVADAVLDRVVALRAARAPAVRP